MITSKRKWRGRGCRRRTRGRGGKEERGGRGVGSGGVTGGDYTSLIKSIRCLWWMLLRGVVLMKRTLSISDRTRDDLVALWTMLRGEHDAHSSRRHQPQHSAADDADRVKWSQWRHRPSLPNIGLWSAHPQDGCLRCQWPSDDLQRFHLSPEWTVFPAGVLRWRKDLFRSFHYFLRPDPHDGSGLRFHGNGFVRILPFRGELCWHDGDAMACRSRILSGEHYEIMNRRYVNETAVLIRYITSCVRS